MNRSDHRLHHGGDLTAAERRFGRPVRGRWLDLSTGINPTAYPLPDLPAEAWSRLPDRKSLARLIDAAQGYYGVPAADCIVAAPGSQALIQWLPRLHAPGPEGAVAVLTPTYGEHARAWAMAGCAVESIADLADVADRHAVVVLANPNNPDGRRFDPDRLRALADRLSARGGLLVVDEAFADVAPELSLAGAAGRPGLVVLRSFGKFFGLGGLRLGFALGPPPLIAALAEALGPWAVSGPAVHIGAAALADTAWIAAARQRLAEGACRLDALLSGAGFSILGGTDLFRLTEHPEAPVLFERLGRAGILARDFPERPQWLRFGIPTKADLARLSDVLNDRGTPEQAASEA